MFMAGSGGGTDGGMSAFMASAANMKAAAAEGYFAADPESGQALVQAFRKRLRWASSMAFKMHALGEEPALGSSPAANTYKPFFASLATDPDEGLAPQWEKFMQVLQDTADAIEESMKNYQETDTGQAGGMTTMSGEIY